MNAIALMLKPINCGWAVAQSDGRELIRFTGLGARRRALRYLERLGTGAETRVQSRSVTSRLRALIGGPAIHGTNA
jgi:hypothetical protein